jgi:hypothetical protein
MIAVAVLCALLVTWAAAGGRVLAVFKAEPPAAGERLLVSMAIGMVLCGLVGEGLAAVGALRAWPLALAGAVSLGIGFGPLRSTVSRLRPRLDPRTLLILAPALAALFVVLVSYATPPIGGDQTKYQLAYPRFYARAGSLVPSTSIWGYQQFAQNFVYAVGYAAGGEFVARVLASVTEVLAAAAFGVLVERHLLPRTGLIAGVVFFTLPICWSQMARAGVDTAVALYALLATTAVLDWRATREPGALWRTALVAGCAASCKVFGLLVPTLVGLVVLVELARQHVRFGRTIGRAVGYGLLVLGVCVPFYVRNTVATGNPIYPFGYAALGGRDWNADADHYLDFFFNQYQRHFAERRAGKPYQGVEVVRFPWDVTMYPESFERSARQTLDLGPIALAFLPAIVLVRRRRPAVWTAALVGTAFIAIVATTAWPHPRYVLPGVALCMAAALAGARELLGRRGFQWLLIGTIAGNLALTAKLLTVWPDQVRVLAGRMSTETFMAKYSPRWDFWHAANPVVSDRGRVLVLGKIIHPYDIDVPFVMASMLEQAWLDYRRTTTVEAFTQIVRGLSVSHVAVDLEQLTAAGDPYEAQVGGLWSEFVRTECDLIFERAGFGLYALRQARAAALGGLASRG